MSQFSRKATAIIAVLVMIGMMSIDARRFPHSSQPFAAAVKAPTAHFDSDLQAAATGHHRHGRVHIKVYRGPSDGHHASHGFWVKQPADDDRHY